MVLAVTLSVVQGVLLVIVVVTAIYSMMSGRPKRRRDTARYIALLATSVVLLTEAHARTGWIHWMNLAAGVFGISCVVLQAVWDRRKRSRGKPVGEPNSA